MKYLDDPDEPTNDQKLDTNFTLNEDAPDDNLDELLADRLSEFINKLDQISQDLSDMGLIDR